MRLCISFQSQRKVEGTIKLEIELNLVVEESNEFSLRRT